MLWLRGILFTLLAPGVVGVVVPLLLDPDRAIRGGLWATGWIPIAAGSIVYGMCLVRFLTSGGTPAIFFTRPIRLLVGEEPKTLVRDTLYRFSRNPMYVGVLLVVFGQAIVFASANVALYGSVLWLLFHLIVVFQEEPHLRGTYGAAYDRYCRHVPRWFGWR